MGHNDSAAVRTWVGTADGFKVEAIVGVMDGAAKVGVELGLIEGAEVGMLVGISVVT